jgi:hypothetical protein
MPLVADGPYPRACHTSSGLMNWNFYFSCADQGILYWECALASKTGWVPETTDPFYRKRSAVHYYGDLKPWRPVHGVPPTGLPLAPYLRARAAASELLPSFDTQCPFVPPPTPSPS